MTVCVRRPLVVFFDIDFLYTDRYSYYLIQKQNHMKQLAKQHKEQVMTTILKGEEYKHFIVPRSSKSLDDKKKVSKKSRSPQSPEEWNALLRYHNGGETFHTQRCWITIINKGDQRIARITPHALQATGSSNLKKWASESSASQRKLDEFDSITLEEICTVIEQLIAEDRFSYGKHTLDLRVSEIFKTPREIYLSGTRK